MNKFSSQSYLCTSQRHGAFRLFQLHAAGNNYLFYQRSCNIDIDNLIIYLFSPDDAKFNQNVKY